MSAARTVADAAPVPVARHVRAVLLLPFMNTVLIPGSILALARDYRLAIEPAALPAVAFGALLMLGGLGLVIRSIALFVRIGEGTLAPWDPTRVLVTSGIYRLSRNPMKTGLFLTLAGECLLTGSRALLIWSVAFMAANVCYIRWFEERGLKLRFGAAYAAYCEQVPRWLGLRSFRRKAARPAAPAGTAAATVTEPRG